MIALRDLGRTYALPGATPVVALHDVTLDIHDGEMVAIMGQSGSGKSTLLNLLGCLDRPTTGTYHLDGVDVGRLDADGRAELRNGKIGFIFQSFNLLPRTSARENVALPLLYGTVPPAQHAERVRAALTAVGLGALGDRLPQQLSGGQQQRVAIARALVTHPRMLLADEPTGNLDSATSEEIMDLLCTLNREQGQTTIVVTHDPDAAARMPRVIVLRDGAVARDGPKTGATR